MVKNWRLLPRTAPDLLEQLLLNRGLTDEAAARVFLQPDYGRDVHDPFLLKDMARAAERILEVVDANQKILIFADFDADGVPGGVLLADFFRKIGFENFSVYVPDREAEGHGLTEPALRQFAQAGSKLVVTVDCGISNVAEVVLANSLGLEVIITDHHLPPPDGEVPPAYAIVNPKQTADPYPFKELCGAGVAFKLVQALAAKARLLTGWEKWLLDLVAIATVSDRVPLSGENRALVYFGLKVLRQTRRPGLLALFQAMNLSREHITEDDIGFMIGPRLNASSGEAYALLTGTDPAAAERIARALEERNQKRREETDRVLAAASQAAAKADSPLVVLGDLTWPVGVLGLAAGRLAEQYSRPVFLWGRDARGDIRSSGRSDGSVNLVELMQTAGGNDFFSQFGGHPMAAGFTIGPNREVELGSRLLEAYRRLPKKETMVELKLEAELSLDDIPAAAAAVEQLAPYGETNPKPIFLFSGLTLESVRTFGNGGLHLELNFAKSSGGKISAIGFFAGRGFHSVNLASGETVDLAASIEHSFFRGVSQLRLRIVDLRQAE